MALLALLVSVVSTAVAVYSLAFGMFSWAQSNRPLVTVRVTTHSGGNINTLLNLVMENTGNRPAFDIRLLATLADVKAAMLEPEDEIPKDAERAFFSEVFVPVLANGREITGSFGLIGVQGVWRAGATLPVKVSYRSLGGRLFMEACTLLLADDTGFAQVFWEASPASQTD